ncbi:MAG: serine hydrolase [Alteromonadaceae bacterium]|nr:serine hydrolase [Alteromonadaceae bacterium]
MLNKFIILIFLLCFSVTSQAANKWPSEAQTELVKQRQANFPWQNIVAAVDWYSPLEQVPGATNPAPLPEALNENDKYTAAEKLVAQYNSYALLIWQNGALRYERYWPGFSQQSRYDTASMHKTVVALLVGAALADGKITSLTQPVSDFLTNVKPTALGNAPLRSLLEMSSGIGGPAFSSEATSVGMQTFLGDDLKQAYQHWPMEHGLNAEFHYSNANPQYLSWVIEQATGLRYADYLSQRLWQPLGASDARVWLDHEQGSARTSCCLQASARDWLRIGLLIMNEGRVGDKQIIPAKFIRDMVSPSALNPNYGWQIWRGSPHNPNRKYSRNSPFSVPAKQPFNADDVYYLDGSGAQRVYIVPSQQTVIVRIGQPSQDWDDAALPNLILK